MTTEPNTRHVKMLIIGSGPAGYTAAIYAARANLQPLMITGPQPGGQLTITTDVENFPGFADAVQGPWLMEQMQKQAEHVGTEIIYDFITAVDTGAKPFKAMRENGDVITADSLVICTGAQARWLGLENEYKFRGYGVSACATCDGFFFKNQDVAVIGGGNSAVEEALFLTNFAKSVMLIHRRDTLRAEKIAQERLLKHPKVKIIWNTAVDDILGNPIGGPNAGVTGLRLRDVNTNALTELAVTGVFIAIGHDPATDRKSVV